VSHPHEESAAVGVAGAAKLSRSRYEPLASEATAQSLHALSLDDWQTLVESHPCSNSLHHRNWLELLMAQYGFRPLIFSLQRAGQSVAAIPFLETRRLSGKRRLVALPFTDSIRVLSQDAEAVNVLYQRLGVEAPEPYRVVMIRTDCPADISSPPSPWVRHELAVPDSLAALEKGLPDNLKRNIRKAQRSNLQFDWVGDSTAMDNFYRLHLMTRKKLGVPIQPRSFFRRLHQRMIQSGLGRIASVSADGEVIAAAVFFTYKQSMIYKYAASNPRALAVRPNEFMVYHALQQAMDNGYTQFDFGISQRTDDGLRRFKRKWGAGEIDVRQICIRGTLPARVEDSLGLKLASFTIRHTPPVVCRALGEAFYRFSQ
jgi:CelD/BcsL family acetyltransferase involved in cellulose biosynthesis